MRTVVGALTLLGLTSPDAAGQARMQERMATGARKSMVRDTGVRQSNEGFFWDLDDMIDEIRALDPKPGLAFGAAPAASCGSKALPRRIGPAISCGKNERYSA